MSLICIGVASLPTTSLFSVSLEKIAQISKEFNRGIFFELDWTEPIFEKIPSDTLKFYVTDSVTSANCEMLFLPDNWFYNGRTNSQSFDERMAFLTEISKVFTANGVALELYIGTSGSLHDEYESVSATPASLIPILQNTIGVNGTDTAVHFVIHP